MTTAVRRRDRERDRPHRRAAVLLGVAIGYATPAVGLVLLGLVALAAMVLRLEWAVLVVIATAVFEDYLARLDPSAVKVLGVAIGYATPAVGLVLLGLVALAAT
ncbi:MAG: hypothetical protein EON52_13490, partial [Actinomycetales bacterium]